jgi:hypothetical protein
MKASAYGRLARARPAPSAIMAPPGTGRDREQEGCGDIESELREIRHGI